jgi:hypothetical protein
MKRLLILLMLFIGGYSANVSGLEKIITLPGVGDNALLAEDDYLLQQPQVNWQQPGSYLADYYAPSLHSGLTREIEILSKSALLQGLVFLTEIGAADASGFYLKDIEYLSRNEYFLYGGKDTGYYPYQTQEMACFPYLAFYRDGMLVWEKYFQKERYGYIKDACLTEKGIALIGEYDTSAQKRNIFVCEIDKNQEIHYFREIHGSNDDYASRIYYEGGYLYLFGKTTSTDLDYRRYIETTDDIYVAKLSLTDHAYYTFNLLGNEGDDILYDALLLNDRLYLFCRFRGNGYYYNPSGYAKDFDAIIFLEDDLDIGSWISLSGKEPENDPHFFAFKERIYLASYGSSKLRLQIYDPELLELPTKTITVPTGNIINCHLLSSDDLILATISITETGRKHLHLFRFGEELNPHVQTTNEISASANHLHNFFQDEDGFLLLPIFSRSQKRVYFLSYENYRLEEEQISNQDYTKYSTALFFNDKSVKKELIRSDIPANPFGEYRELYRYRLNNKDFYFEDVYLFHLKTSIRNHEVYDVGLILTFNGEGFLNGAKTATGTRIATPGHYLLEIVSASKTETLAFSVQALSEDAPCVPAELPQEILLSVPSATEEAAPPQLHLSQTTAPQQANLHSYLIVLGIVLGGIGGILLAGIRFKGRKHA